MLRLLCWPLARSIPSTLPGASELHNNTVPLAAGGRGLFILVPAGLVSHTKHLYFLLIKLSPGDTSVPTPLAAFIRVRTGPSFGASGCGCKAPQPGRAGISKQSLQRWDAGICIRDCQLKYKQQRCENQCEG